MTSSTVATVRGYAALCRIGGEAPETTKDTDSHQRSGLDASWLKNSILQTRVCCLVESLGRNALSPCCSNSLAVPTLHAPCPNAPCQGCAPLLAIPRHPPYTYIRSTGLIVYLKPTTRNPCSMRYALYFVTMYGVRIHLPGWA